MLYQRPLAYLLGLEGVALLRAFVGEHDRDFVEARLAEVRQLLNEAELHDDGVEMPPVSTSKGYSTWAATYDEPGNALVDIEQPIVWEILEKVPVGRALDVACGTGRHAVRLAELGHQVVGIDTSPEMLAVARSRLGADHFIRADLHHLPLPDEAVDVVVCALALTHAPSLRPALAELARVLTPGGHLVLSDSAGLAAGLRPPIVVAATDGRPRYLPHHNRRASEYLKAALPLGFEVRRCEEPRLPVPYVDPNYRPSAQEMLPPGPPDIWWLHHWFPAATNAAFHDTPVGIIWHFQLRG
jgi:SAM-dependent methyltransferase